MSNNYKYNNFIDLAELLNEQYGFLIYDVYKNVIEVRMDDNIPILRLLFNENTGDMITCFHINITATEAIQIFDFIKNRYKLIQLGESYYEDATGRLYLGPDAYAAHDAELEQHYLANANNDYEEYIPECPVTYIVKQAIYSCDHPQAKKELKKFKDRKKIW